MTYRELFRLGVDKVNHKDPHLFFERLSRAVNESAEFDTAFKVMWDCEELEYTVLMEDYE